MLHHLARLTHVRTVLSHDLVAPLRRVQPHGARAAEALPHELQDAVVGRALRRVGGQLRDLGAHFEHGLGGARLLILLGLGDALRLAQLHVQRHGMLGEGGDGRRGVGRRLRDGAHLLARRLRREEVRDVGGGASPAAAGAAGAAAAAAAAAALLLLLPLLGRRRRLHLARIVHLVEAPLLVGAPVPQPIADVVLLDLDLRPCALALAGVGGAVQLLLAGHRGQLALLVDVLVHDDDHAERDLRGRARGREIGPWGGAGEGEGEERHMTPATARMSAMGPNDDTHQSN